MFDLNSSVLLVEDNPTDALLLKATFKRAHLDGVLTVVEDCERAYRWILARFDSKEGLPDLVLLDIGLPGESGMEMLEKLKTTPILSEIPVAVLTGSSQTRDMAKARQLGAEWYFVKKSEPRDLDLMLKALSKLCN